MKEFDNIQTEGLKILLNENTTLKRFYPLIPIKNQIVSALLASGILDKYIYNEQYEKDAEALSQETRLDVKTLALINSLYHFHDFKKRKLSEISISDPRFIPNLIDNGIKTSDSLLKIAVIENGIRQIAQRFDADEAIIMEVVSICDLMRLPGVKSIRARLYYDCGIRNLADFSGETYQHIQQTVAEYIAFTNCKRVVPLPKELTTQIAVAQVLPHIL